MIEKIRQEILANLVVIKNAGSMMGATVITSGLGFIFWWVAARYFSTQSVGLASAAISTMTLSAILGMFGLGTGIIGVMARHKTESGSLISAALCIVTVMSSLFGFLYVLFAANLSTELAALSATVLNIIMFVLGVALTGFTMMLDQSFVGLLKSHLLMWRNAAFAIIKLLLLVAAGLFLANRNEFTIYNVWTLGNIISTLMLTAVLLRQRQRIFFRPRFDLLRDTGRNILGHHVLNLVLQAPGQTLPLIVTALLSAEVNAAYYAAWMLANFAFLVPTYFATVLYAAASDPVLLGTKMRFTLRFSALVGTVSSITFFLGSDFVLRFFGASYADNAGWALRILGLGIFAQTIKTHFVVVNRVKGRTVRTAAIMAVGVLCELTAAALGAHFGGLTGLAGAFIMVNYVEAGLMFPTIWRTITIREASPTAAAAPQLTLSH